MERRRTQRVRYAGAFLAGVAAVYVGRYTLDHTQLADRVVSSLLVTDDVSHADAIVVLGGGVTGTCSPNLNSLRRVMLAADLFHQGWAPQLVITGGPSTDSPCAVARTMERMASRLGVPERAVLVEASSRSTRENAERTAPMLRALGVRRILIVTDRLHLSRALASFRQFGFAAVPVGVPIQEGHLSNSEMLMAGLREYAALAYYRWNKWIDQPPPESEHLVTSLPAATDGDAAGLAHPRGPVVVLGASYAAGWTPSLAGVSVINRGIPGQQSSELLARFKVDVVDEQPRAVIVWGFINDIFRASRESVGDAAKRAQDNYVAMVQHGRQARIEVILATEVTVRAPKTLLEPVLSLAGAILHRPNYQDYVNAHVMRMNGWLRALAARERLLLLDLEPVLAQRDARRARQFSLDDGSHISKRGYDLLSEHFVPVLTRHLESAPQESIPSEPMP